MKFAMMRVEQWIQRHLINASIENLKTGKIYYKLSRQGGIKLPITLEPHLNSDFEVNSEISVITEECYNEHF